MLSRIFSEFIGTMFLLMIIVGSGIMAENLTSNQGIILLANSLATVLGLIVLILMFGDISGGHFNPVVSTIFFMLKELPFRQFFLYLLAQTSGAILGVILANIMFDLSFVEISTKDRDGLNIFLSEIIATFGLLMTILLVRKNSKFSTPYAVGFYIGAGYWFTSSTSFANPAVSIARSLTNTFTGINPEYIFFFILAQLIGGFVAFYVYTRIYD